MSTLAVCASPVVSMVLASLLATAPACASIPDFLDTCYREISADYFAFYESEFAALCDDHAVDRNDASNREKFLRVHLLHDLLTTCTAVDGARGGMLGVPYFWHWVQPNPRHSIRSLPDSTALCEIDPPASYARYATFADIDRVPALFLGDLFTEEPGYFHPGTGAFHSFGWCSEREMAFTALATSWGFESKVWQSGIHTCSVVRVSFRSAGGGPTILSAWVDNTFDEIDWRTEESGRSLESWREDTGNGTQIDWYNRMARTPEQLRALLEIEVSPRAGERIRAAVRNFISR